MFIAIEGIDGLGKSTLCRRLVPLLTQHLSRKVFLVHDPDDSPFGAFVHDLWHSSENPEAVYWPLIFAASSTKAQVERWDLGVDTILMSDRCALSTFAYCYSEAAPLSWIEVLHHRYQYPDLTIYLDIAPQTAARRLLADGRELEGTVARLHSLRDRYLVALDSWKSHQRSILIVDVNGPAPDDFAIIVAEIILDFLRNQ